MDLYQAEYGKYFTSFPYFVNLFHEPVDESNDSKIWGMSEIFANITWGLCAIANLSLALISSYSTSMQRKLPIKK